MFEIPRSARVTGSLLIVWLLGCGTVRPVPPVAAAAMDSIDTSTSLAGQFRMDPVVSFVNGAPPRDAMHPEAGAEFVYVRAGSENSRMAPVDIEIAVVGDSGLSREQLEKRLTRVYREVYGWDPAQWRQALGARADASDIIRTKSNFFWESLSQHMAERIFESYLTPTVFLYGPACVGADGVNTCGTDGLAGIQELRVQTTIDGRRDPLNPQTRSIVYVARRGQLSNPSVFLELHIPDGLQVSGPKREFLDLRPIVAGKRATETSFRVLVELPAKARTRTQNGDYADYNLVFLPLRHLVFQGHVQNPKGPDGALEYQDIASFRRRFTEVMSALRRPDTAAPIARLLEPFVTSKYYYMFDAGQGVKGYRDYILGAGGIAGGISPDVGRVELIIERAQ